MSRVYLYGKSIAMWEHIFSPSYVESAIEKSYSFNQFLNDAPTLFQVSYNIIRGNPDLERVCLIKKGDEHVQYFEHTKKWQFIDIHNIDAFNDFGIDVMWEAVEKCYVMLFLEKTP